MTSPLVLIDRWRQRYHPLHQIRRAAAFRRLARTVDRPIWARVYGVSHPVRLYLLRNSSYLVNRRSPEPHIAALMLAIARTQPIASFWDVGANIGYYSWLIASASAKTRVLAVEPDPTNYFVLTQSRTHAPSVETLNVAISRGDGTAIFQVDSVTGATGTLEGQDETYNFRNFGEAARSVEVPTRSMDSLAAEFGLPDLIKIDVEGHEGSVIDGATQVLASRPLVLIESFDPDSHALNSLRAQNYHLVGADTLTEARPSDGNYLAVARERTPMLGNVRAAYLRSLADFGLEAAGGC